RYTTLFRSTRSGPHGFRRDAAERTAGRDRAPRHRGRSRRASRDRRVLGGDGVTTISTLTLAPWTNTAGAPLRVVVVNGSPSEKSKTMGLVDVVVETLRDLLGPRGRTVAESRIDVYRLGEGFTGARSREDVTPEVEAALRRAEEA